jgi:hypothetical protein
MRNRLLDYPELAENIPPFVVTPLPKMPEGNCKLPDLALKVSAEILFHQKIKERFCFKHDDGHFSALGEPKTLEQLNKLVYVGGQGFN